MLKSLSPLFNPTKKDHNFTIAVDLTPVRLDGSVGGVMPLAVELLKGFASRGDVNLMLLCASWNRGFFSELKLSNSKIVEVISINANTSNKNFLRSNNVDVLFCPFSAPTYSEFGIPTVSTINDIQHKFYPNLFSNREYDARNKFYLDLISKVSGVICISNYTKETFCNEYNFPRKKAATIYISIHDRFNKKTNPELYKKLGIVEEEYIFYPANFWEHKNHRFLLLAFAHYIQKSKNKKLKLVLTGNTLDKEDFFKAVCEELGIANRVCIIGYVSQNELEALLAGMKGLIFPSLYEGFGIPVIEAMHFNKLIACSDNTSLPEVGGDCVRYFNPARLDELVSAIEYLETSGISENQIKKYEQKLTAFNMNKMVSNYLTCLRNVAAEGDTGAYQFENSDFMYADGWSRAHFRLRFNDNSEKSVFSATVLLPEFALKCRLLTIYQENKERSYKIKRGEELLLEIPLSKDYTTLEFKITPAFIPRKALRLRSDDERELGVIFKDAEVKKIGEAKLL